MPKELKLRPDLLITLVLTLIIAVVIIWLLPSQTKYNLQIENVEILSANEIKVYDDLDFDGDSELIRFNRDFLGQSAMLVENGEKIRFQFNLPTKFVPLLFYFFADYNNNGRKEIFLFTHQNDSIFLDAIDSKTQERIIKRQYITNYRTLKGKVDFGIHDIITVDVNKDGSKELMFSIYCAFSKFTRKIGRYDIKNKTLFLSKKAGACLYNKINVLDLDKDGIPEFFGDIPTYGNCSTEYPYSDLYAWLMVYDTDMKYKFPPKKVGKYSARLSLKPFAVKNKNVIASFYNHSGTVDSSYLAIFDVSGNKIKSQILDSNKKLRHATFDTYQRNGKYFMALYLNNGLIEVYDENVQKVREYESTPFSYYLNEIDLNGDGSNEYLFLDKNKRKLIATSFDYLNPVSCVLEQNTRLDYFSKVIRNKKLEAIQFVSGNSLYKLKYTENIYFKIRDLIHLGIFMIVFVAAYFLGKLYQFYLRRRYEDEKRITTLQVKSINQQMSPHFTLNILNSIGNLYENHDKQKAQYYFGKYSKLLRTTLISSGEIAVSLEDELQFTQNYLELERLRLNDGFNIQLIDNQNIPDIRVPKFLIHTFAENAVKHGLFPLQGIREGIVKLHINEEKNHIQIMIEDNGVGRTISKNQRIQTTGKGLSILDEILELYRRVESRKITYQIEDKYTDREETGTRVTIFISNN